MHTRVFINKMLYRETIGDLVTAASKRYDKACYISFNDPFHIVINFLEEVKVDRGKFVVVDASKKKLQGPQQEINRLTYVLGVQDLFKVYMFLRTLIQREKINYVLVDSLSALINKFSDLPLKRMLTDLLLEVGAWKCSTSLVVFKDHEKHDVIEHIDPFIAKNVVL